MNLFDVYAAKLLCLALDLVQSKMSASFCNACSILYFYLPCPWDCALLFLALNFCLPSALTLWICHQKPGGWGLGSAQPRLPPGECYIAWRHSCANTLERFVAQQTTRSKNKLCTSTMSGDPGLPTQQCLRGGGDSWRVDLSLKYSPALLNLRAPLDICNYNLGKQLKIKNVKIFQTYVNT